MSSGAVKVLPSQLLSLKDRLSRLTFTNACKLLGPLGRLLISSNANKWEINIPDDVLFDGDTLRVKFPTMLDEPPITVTIERNPEALQSLRFHCDACKNACDHVGAVFSMVLEEKTALGLAVPPPELQLRLSTST